MGNYFSFERFITKNFVRALYFLGFVVLTIGGIALAIWAGLRLNDASIDRELGWRYVALGVAAVTLGNLGWRIFCELWIVLFNMNARLASIDRSFNPSHREAWRNSGRSFDFSQPAEKTEAPVKGRAVANEDYDSSRSASVLGLT
jgi:hypothetical protein